MRALPFDSKPRAPFNRTASPRVSPLLVQGLQSLGRHTQRLDLQGAVLGQAGRPLHLDCLWHIHLSLHSGVQHILKAKVPRICWVCRREKTKGVRLKGASSSLPPSSTFWLEDSHRCPRTETASGPPGRPALARPSVPKSVAKADLKESCQVRECPGGCSRCGCIGHPRRGCSSASSAPGRRDGSA